MIGYLASFQETGFKPIRKEFALLGGRSLANNLKPVLLSTLAIVAVSQGRGLNLTPLFVWESACCLGEWQGRCCGLVTCKNLRSDPIGSFSGGRC